MPKTNSPSTNTELKVLIADDHPVFRQGLRQIIEQDSRFHVLEEAGNGEATLQLALHSGADLLVLDIRMPGLDGFKVVRQLREQNCPIKVIFLTMHDEEDMFQEAMDLGIKGYVLKDSVANDILNGMDAVAGGRAFISPSLSEYLFRRREQAQSFRHTQPGWATLTPAEKRVLNLISKNLLSKEIASILNVSTRTVENHRARICAKLGLHGVHSLVKFAFDHRSDLEACKEGNGG